MVSVGKRRLTVDDIPQLPQTKITDLESTFVKNDEFKTQLSDNAEIIVEREELTLSVVTTGNKHYLVVEHSIDGTKKTDRVNIDSFYISGIISNVEVKWYGDGYPQSEGPYIVFTTKTETGEAERWISLKSVVEVYKSGDGITITNEGNIEVDKTVTRNAEFTPVYDYSQDL